MMENSPYLLAMQPQPPYPRGGIRTTGRLCVDSDPKSSYVYVDGIIVTDPRTGESKKTPFCTEIVEGRRDIVVRSEGYDDITRYVDIFPGKTTNINVNLRSGKPGKVLPFSLGLYLLSKLIL